MLHLSSWRTALAALRRSRRRPHWPLPTNSDTSSGARRSVAASTSVARTVAVGYSPSDVLRRETCRLRCLLSTASSLAFTCVLSDALPTLQAGTRSLQAALTHPSTSVKDTSRHPRVATSQNSSERRRADADNAAASGDAIRSPLKYPRVIRHAFLVVLLIRT